MQGPLMHSVTPLNSAAITPLAAIDEAVRAGRWQDAESSARRLLSQQVDDAGLWHRLGHTLWGQGRLNEAADAYQKAASLRPDWIEGFVSLIDTLLRLDRLGEAVSLGAAAVGANPQSFQTHYYLGLALMRQQNNEAAVAPLRRAAELNPANAEAHHALGDALWALDRENEAVGAYREAVRLRPEFDEVLNHLGYIAYVRGSMHEAEDFLRRAAAAAPESASAHYYLGRVLLQNPRAGESIAAFQRAVACSPRWVEARVDLAYAYASQGRLAAAETEAREGVFLGPESLDAHIALISVLSQARRQSEAEEVARKALSLAPDYAGIHSRLAEILFYREKFDEAAAEAEAALRLDESLPYPHYLLGLVHMRREEREPALEHFQRYLERSPDDSLGVGLYLAHLGAAYVPERSPETYLNRLYHTRAGFWDETVVSERPYRGASMVAGALSRIRGAAISLDILDAGCGTGLVGVLIRPQARRLDGIDLSAHMLEKAAAKGIYDQLDQGDMVACMQGRRAAYDVVTSAATLIHFGDLRPVFCAAAIALRVGGLFIFTLFPHEGEGVVVNSYSCYSHSLAYVKEHAGAAGFAVELAEQDVHEYNGELPVMGWIIALRRLSD